MNGRIGLIEKAGLTKRIEVMRITRWEAVAACSPGCGNFERHRPSASFVPSDRGMHRDAPEWALVAFDRHLRREVVEAALVSEDTAYLSPWNDVTTNEIRDDDPRLVGADTESRSAPLDPHQPERSDDQEPSSNGQQNSRDDRDQREHAREGSEQEPTPSLATDLVHRARLTYPRLTTYCIRRTATKLTWTAGHAPGLAVPAAFPGICWHFSAAEGAIPPPGGSLPPLRCPASMRTFRTRFT